MDNAFMEIMISHHSHSHLSQRPFLFACASVAISLGSAALAGPLQQAEVHKIVNDVRVIDSQRGSVRPAALRDVIAKDLAVRTGVESRAELLFQDDTLTRLGAETVFSFKPGTRDMNLDKGTMLLQVPKGLGGARIRAAAVTAAITGTTIMIENLPNKNVKVLVLEGSLRLSLNGVFGESVVLKPGKMVIVGPKDRVMPQPVTVDLSKLVKTSALIDPVKFSGGTKTKVDVLPSIGLIQKEIATQAAAKGKAQMADTNLLIQGNGTQVVMASKETMAVLEASVNSGSSKTPILITLDDSSKQIPAARVVAQRANTSSALAGASGSGASGGSASGGGTSGGRASVSGASISGASVSGTSASTTTPTGPAFILSPSPYLINNTTVFKTSNTTVRTGGVTDAGGLYQSATVNAPASVFLFDTPTAFDTASNFDATFGVKNGGTAPAAGTAVYRFTALSLTNTPTFQVAGGPLDIALVSQSGITSTNSGPGWALDSLRSLSFSSVSGPITLSPTFQKTNPFSAFSYMQVYARGTTGLATLDGTFNILASDLYVSGEAGVHFTSGSKVMALNVTADSPAVIALDGIISATNVKLNSSTSIQISKAPAVFTLEATAPTFATTDNLGVTSGFLNIGGGGLTTSGKDLTGFDSITVAGNADVGNVLVSNALTIGGTLTTSVPNGKITLAASSITVGGGISLDGANIGHGGSLTVNATEVLVDTAGISGITANGANASAANLPGNNGGTVNINTTLSPGTGAVTVNAPIIASTGNNGSAVTGGGGNGGTVGITAKGTIAVNSTVRVSDSTGSRTSAKGGNITLSSRKTTGTAISVGNSGQLLSLLNSAAPTTNGGMITFVSDGGLISVSGGTVAADRGTVDIRNNGINGNVQLTNASIRGDTVKVGALGAGGQLLIGGGSINADTALKLYAGSSTGQVRFTDSVTLGGNGTKAIAGMTVTVAPSKVVTIGGTAPAAVYTNNPNYTGSGGNGTSSGTFGGQGATTKPFVQRPAF